MPGAVSKEKKMRTLNRKRREEGGGRMEIKKIGAFVLGGRRLASRLFSPFRTGRFVCLCAS